MLSTSVKRPMATTPLLSKALHTTPPHVRAAREGGGESGATPPHRAVGTARVPWLSLGTGRGRSAIERSLREGRAESEIAFAEGRVKALCGSYAALRPYG